MSIFSWLERGRTRGRHSGGKFMRRHGVTAATATAACLAIVGGAFGLAPQTESTAASATSSSVERSGRSWDGDHSWSTYRDHSDHTSHDGDWGNIADGDAATPDATDEPAPVVDDTVTVPDSTTGTGTDTGATEPEPEPTTVPVPVPAPIPEAPVVVAPSSGWPTGSSTGVPAGTSLAAMRGLTVSVAGTVIDAKHVSGDIVINADNVTIKNSRVDGRIQIRPPYKNLLVQRVEIAGPGGEWASKTEGIGYSNFTCDGCNIHGWGKGAMLDGNVTIKNSWIHDMPTYGTAETGSHNEAILSLGGPNFTIVNNRLDSGAAGNFTASLAFLNQWNAFTNTLVQRNLFNGGGYCVYAGGEAAHNNVRPSSNVRFLDNTFGTDANPKCGYYGAAVAWYSGGTGNQWSGNVMSTGAVVSPPSAG